MRRARRAANQVGRQKDRRLKQKDRRLKEKDRRLKKEGKRPRRKRKPTACPNEDEDDDADGRDDAVAMEAIMLERLDNEVWWGGAVADGARMPFDAEPVYRDLGAGLGGGQASPLMISSRGRWVVSATGAPFALSAEATRVVCRGEDSFLVGSKPSNLRSGLRELNRAATEWVPTAPPARRMFTEPQYNTWIALNAATSQAGVIRYAEALLEHGFPPGVLMIDDGWQEDFGIWDFHPKRFPDPTTMLTRLEELGFAVMLWVVPYVSPDSSVYRELQGQDLLLHEAGGDALIGHWWNGQSAVFDLTRPEAIRWWQTTLHGLEERYGVVGFKFDGGDPEFFRGARRDAVQRSLLWARLGEDFRFNEFRVAWNNRWRPIVARLRDKAHSWEADGLAALIPEGIAAGLLGFPYVCPDMVGGGEIGSVVRRGGALDEELMMRFAECSALFPALQFSLMPPEGQDAMVLTAFREMALLHQSLGPTIYEVMQSAAETGDPGLRPMVYAADSAPAETMTRQFLLGEDILVAPQIRRGAREKRVWFPPGRWSDDGGRVFQGPGFVSRPSPPGHLNWFTRA